MGPSDWEDTVLAPSDIALAVEIVSPGESASRDCITKPHEYAANAVPVTWVIDFQQERISLAEFVLTDAGDYQVPELAYGVFSGEVAGITVSIDLDALVGPKR